jgi:hypothetical protein
VGGDVGASNASLEEQSSEGHHAANGTLNYLKYQYKAIDDPVLARRLVNPNGSTSEKSSSLKLRRVLIRRTLRDDASDWMKPRRSRFRRRPLKREWR